MSSTTIRVDAATHARLRAIAQRTGFTLTALIARAADVLDRESFFDDVDAAYARLSRTPGAVADLDAELRQWEVASADGLNLG